MDDFWNLLEEYSDNINSDELLTAVRNIPFHVTRAGYTNDKIDILIEFMLKYISRCPDDCNVIATLFLNLMPESTFTKSQVDVLQYAYVENWNDNVQLSKLFLLWLKFMLQVKKLNGDYIDPFLFINEFVWMQPGEKQEIMLYICDLLIQLAKPLYLTLEDWYLLSSYYDRINTLWIDEIFSNSLKSWLSATLRTYLQYTNRPVPKHYMLKNPKALPLKKDNFSNKFITSLKGIFLTDNNNLTYTVIEAPERIKICEPNNQSKQSSAVYANNTKSYTLPQIISVDELIKNWRFIDFPLNAMGFLNDSIDKDVGQIALFLAQPKMHDMFQNILADYKNPFDALNILTDLCNFCCCGPPVLNKILSNAFKIWCPSNKNIKIICSLIPWLNLTGKNEFITTILIPLGRVYTTSKVSTQCNLLNSFTELFMNVVILEKTRETNGWYRPFSNKNHITLNDKLDLLKYMKHLFNNWLLIALAGNGGRDNTYLLHIALIFYRSLAQEKFLNSLTEIPILNALFVHPNLSILELGCELALKIGSPEQLDNLRSLIVSRGGSHFHFGLITMDFTAKNLKKRNRSEAILRQYMPNVCRFLNISFIDQSIA